MEKRITLSNLRVPTINTTGKESERKIPSICLTPTLNRGSKNDAKSPARNPSLTPVSSSPRRSKSPCHDRLIPSRSMTDLNLASHLLSPLSLGASNYAGICGEKASDKRIFHFGAAIGKREINGTMLAAGNKRKFSICHKPETMMDAPGVFLVHGHQSTVWAPSSIFVVALENVGVYMCRFLEEKEGTDKETSELVGNVEGQDQFRYLAWKEEDRAIVCATLNGQVQIIDLSVGHHTPLWKLESNFRLHSLAMRGADLLTCGYDEEGIEIYDTRKNHVMANPVLKLQSLRNPTSTNNCISWSPNERTLACGGDAGLITLWDIRSTARELPHNIHHEKSPIQVLAWHPWQLSTLFSGHGHPDPSICMQNTATGNLLNKIQCSSGVTGIQFNETLKHMATSHGAPALGPTPATNSIAPGKDGSIQFWELMKMANPSPTDAIKYHEAAITCLCSSPANAQLLAAGADEFLTVWEWGRPTPSASPSRQKERSLLDMSHLIR